MTATLADLKSVPVITLKTLTPQEMRLKKYFDMPLDSLVDELVLIEPRDFKAETEAFKAYDAAFTAFFERVGHGVKPVYHDEIKRLVKKLAPLEIKANGGMASSTELMVLSIAYVNHPYQQTNKVEIFAHDKNKQARFIKQLKKFAAINPMCNLFLGESKDDAYERCSITASMNVTQGQFLLGRISARKKNFIESELSLQKAMSKGSVSAAIDLLGLYRDFHASIDNIQVNKIIQVYCRLKRLRKLFGISGPMGSIWFDDERGDFVFNELGFKQWLTVYTDVVTQLGDLSNRFPGILLFDPGVLIRAIEYAKGQQNISDSSEGMAHIVSIAENFQNRFRQFIVGDLQLKQIISELETFFVALGGHDNYFNYHIMDFLIKQYAKEKYQAIKPSDWRELTGLIATMIEKAKDFEAYKWPTVQLITAPFIHGVIKNVETDLLQEIKSSQVVLPPQLVPVKKPALASVAKAADPVVLEEHTITSMGNPVTVRVIAAPGSDSKTSSYRMPETDNLREARLIRYMNLSASELLKEFFSLDPDVDLHHQYERRDAAFTAVIQRIFTLDGVQNVTDEEVLHITQMAKEIREKLSHGTATSFEMIYLLMRQSTANDLRDKIIKAFKKLAKNNPYCEFMLGLNRATRKGSVTADNKQCSLGVEKNIGISLLHEAEYFDAEYRSKKQKESQTRAFNSCERAMAAGVLRAYHFMVIMLAREKSFDLQKIIKTLFEYIRKSKQQNYILKIDYGIEYDVSRQKFNYVAEKVKAALLKNYKLEVNLKELNSVLEQVNFSYQPLVMNLTAPYTEMPAVHAMAGVVTTVEDEKLIYSEQPGAVDPIVEGLSTELVPLISATASVSAMKSEKISEPASAPQSLVGESIGAFPLKLNSKGTTEKTSTAATITSLSAGEPNILTAEEKEIADEAIAEADELDALMAVMEIKNAPVSEASKSAALKNVQSASLVTQFSAIKTLPNVVSNKSVEAGRALVVG